MKKRVYKILTEFIMLKYNENPNYIKTIDFEVLVEMFGLPILDIALVAHYSLREYE